MTSKSWEPSDTPIKAGDRVRLLNPPIWRGLEVKVVGTHRHYSDQSWYWVTFEHPEGGQSALFDNQVEPV